jgi:hypothetical protein
MMGETKKILKKLVCVYISILFMTVNAKAILVDSNSIVRDGIEYYIQTNKSIYDLGEDVEILYRITNLTEEERRFDYMPPLLDVLVAAKEEGNFNTIWFWWDGTWPAGPAVFLLQPGESVELNAIWPQIDLNGSWEIWDHTQVSPGTYGIGGRIGGSGFNDIIDNSSVTLEIIIIPETGSLVLLGVGFATLFGYNKTRRN